MRPNQVELCSVYLLSMCFHGGSPWHFCLLSGIGENDLKWRGGMRMEFGGLYFIDGLRTETRIVNSMA